MYYLDSVQSNQCFQAIEFVDRPVPEKLYIGFIFCGQEVLQVEGDIVRGGGGDILPNTVRKIGKYRKYRVKSRRNTDTAFMIGYIYAYPSRVLFYLEHVCTINQPPPWQENEKRYLEFFISTTITGARSLEETLIPF